MNAPALISSYAPPCVKLGDYISCAIRGLVKVKEFTADAPIAWPYTTAFRLKRALVICGDLERAIKTESEIAVAYHWGVHVATVARWKHALGVPYSTPGTVALRNENWRKGLTYAFNAVDLRKAAGLKRDKSSAHRA